MKTIDIDKNFIIDILSDEIAYYIISELADFKNYQKRLSQLKNGEVSCTSCMENGVIKPATQEFMSFMFFNITEQNKEIIDRIKLWTKGYYKIQDEIEFKIPYQSQFDDNKVEILI